MRLYIWIFIILILSILIYKNIFVGYSKTSTFWNDMPVMHFNSNYPIDKSIINLTYGNILPDQSNISIFNMNKDINIITNFLNNNYIYGYSISEDYIFRKMNIKDSIGIIYKIDNVIVGFIQSSPYKFINNTFSYVDLLCVHHNYRNLGIAKKLIENIIYYSPQKIFIHKKDNNPLPFKHFYKTSHYSCGVSFLKNKYGIIKTQYKPLIEKVNNNDDIYITSDSIKTYYFNDNYISFSIHHFTMIGTLKIAEIFYLSPNFNDYNDIISIMNENNIDFLVTLPNGIFKNYIEIDYYSKSMDLYVYTFNYVLHPIKDELWFNIP